MKNVIKNPIIRKQVRKRLLEVGIIVLLIISANFLYKYVDNKRAEAFSLQQKIESAPEVAMQASLLESELDSRSEDIDSIYEILPLPEEIGLFVSYIETVANNTDIQVKIPRINEEIQYDNQGKPIKQTGPLFKVSLDLKAAGKPVELLKFLHKIEYSPYLVVLKSFKLKATPQVVPGFISNVPDKAPPGEKTGKPKTSSMLEATFIISLQNNGNRN